MTKSAEPLPYQPHLASALQRRPAVGAARLGMIPTLAILTLLALSGCQVAINEAINFGGQIAVDGIEAAVRAPQAPSSEAEKPKAAP